MIWLAKIGLTSSPVVTKFKIKVQKCIKKSKICKRQDNIKPYRNQQLKCIGIIIVANKTI